MATLLLVLGYGAVSLWPFDWQPPRWTVNHAEMLPGGGLRFARPGVALVEGRPPWLAPALASHRLELDLSIRALAPAQSGPARILTLARDPYDASLTLAQDGGDLILRLRTPATDRVGLLGGRPLVRVPGVLADGGRLDVRIEVAPGRLVVEAGAARRVRPLPGAPLTAWDPAHRVALGNVPTFNRPWRGEIHRAVVRSGAVAVDHASDPALTLPGSFLWTGKYPKLVPLRHLNVADAAHNVLLYLPLGLVLGAWLGGGRGALLAGVLIVLAVSLGMEALQLFVPRRWPSIDDVLFNLVGGTLGLGAIRLVRHRMRPATG